MGTRLKDIVFDRHEDHLYEDERAMRLTPYVMAERCLQVEMAKIFQDHSEGDWDTLAHTSYRVASKVSRTWIVRN